MANTLFIVKDGLFKGLPSNVADGSVAEVKRLLKFLVRFNISITEQGGFPEKLDFTDSVVKIVEEDADVGAFQNDSFRIQLANVVFSAKQHGINVTKPPSGHAPADPDRGGVGFQQKEILDPGNLKLIMTVTGGAASLQTAKEEVIEFAVNGRTQADIERDRNQSINGTPNKKGMGRDAYLKSPQGSKDTQDEKTLALLKKGWSDWPKDLQDNVAVALGRLIAHEARHQYILDHADAGLGSDAAVLFGQKSFEDFEKSDQTDISAKMNSLKQQQADGTTHLETLPKGQPFPFG